MEKPEFIVYTHIKNNSIFITTKELEYSFLQDRKKEDYKIEKHFSKASYLDNCVLIEPKMKIHVS